ncbi:hypothetical protein IKO50_04150 [bacterium]|nr:hypothetical protein [bacterium]
MSKLVPGQAVFFTFLCHIIFGFFVATTYGSFSELVENVYVYQSGSI